MKNRLLIFAIALFSLVYNLSAQKKILINEALAIGIDHPGRRTLSQVDPIEYQLLKGKFFEPKENKKLPGSSSKWVRVKANKDGWFSDRKLRGSYIYYKYESAKDEILILDGKGYYNVCIAA